MAKVLYRKHRPKSFAEVVGQEHIIGTLQNALKNGDVAHAYLFTGPRGTGKTTTARLLTKALNCTGATKKDACLKCDTCDEVENGSFIDLIEIDAASNRGIDDIRELKEGVRFAPNKGSYKVYIIDEAHMLSKEAFNALLKTLEEPPPHTVFVLATTEPHKVLPTIISRTQKFDFRYLNTPEIIKRLEGIVKKEGKKLEPESIRMVVAASGGSLRDAESILGKVLSMGSPSVEDIRTILGLTDLQQVTNLFDHIVNNKKEEAINYINKLTNEGVDMVQYINQSIEYARAILLLKLSPSSVEMITENFSDKEKETALAHTKDLTEKKIYAIIGELMNAVSSVKNSPLPQLPLELAIAGLIKEEKDAG
ncbi:MAG: DNA polymerase III subunit gamma/tau [Candidatus Spechtbacterales bacterium]|nr:DNA polymerase III subunit gamma/tau [Candidatus Spechtbacterales bacterium]